jgi:hypothetical protein
LLARLKVRLERVTIKIDDNKQRSTVEDEERRREEQIRLRDQAEGSG